MGLDLVCQYLKGMLVPVESDKEKLSSEYKANQFIRCKTTRIGSGMEPSVRQNGLLHACFQLVADNTENPSLNTLEKVKFSCKVHLDFRDPTICFVRPDGVVQFKYKSFSFAELRNMERLNIFNRAFQYCAELLGITVEELVREAQNRMGR